MKTQGGKNDACEKLKPCSVKTGHYSLESRGANVMSAVKAAEHYRDFSQEK